MSFSSFLVRYFDSLCLRELFAYPVDEAIAPGYKKIVKRPMDLNTIQRKVDAKATDEHIIECARLLWTNAKLYNPPNHPSFIRRELRFNRMSRRDVQSRINIYDPYYRRGDNYIDEIDPEMKNRTSRSAFKVNRNDIIESLDIILAPGLSTKEKQKERRRK